MSCAVSSRGHQARRYSSRLRSFAIPPAPLHPRFVTMPAAGAASSRQAVEDPTLSEDEAYAEFLQSQGYAAEEDRAEEVAGEDDGLAEQATETPGEPHDVVSRVIREAARAHTERAPAGLPRPTTGPSETGATGT